MKAINDADEEKPEMHIAKVKLKYLNAKTLQAAITNMSTTHGSITFNEAENSIIVCDKKDTLDDIVAKVKSADTLPQQIMVEVVILDVKLTDASEIGVNWDILTDNWDKVQYRQNFTTSRLISTEATATNVGEATQFNTRGLGGDFSIVTGLVRNVVHLIQQKRDVEILASPRVMVVSGKEATIEAIEELPYTEVQDSSDGGSNSLTSTKFKNVGVKLIVTATMTDENEILLDVEAEQNVTTGASNTEVPIIDTRKTNTSLILRSGQIVVMGGMRRQHKSRQVEKIPLVSDIPLIGGLFRNTSDSVENSELVIFISPRIYDGSAPNSDMMEKYKEITEKPLLKLPPKDKPGKDWMKKAGDQIGDFLLLDGNTEK